MTGHVDTVGEHVDRERDAADSLRGSDVRWAVNSQTLPHASLEEFLELAGIVGFYEVELAGDILDAHPEPTAAVARGGRSVVGVSPTRRCYNWNSAWDAEVAGSLRREISRASDLGASYFVLPFMGRPGTRATAVHGAREAIAIADELDIRIALESVGHNPDHRAVSEVSALVHEVDHPRLGLQIDAFHFFRAGHRVADLERVDVPLWSVQISNSNGRPIDELFGYRDRTFPLDGPFPISEFVRGVHRRWPEAPISVEVLGDYVRAHDSSDNADHARRDVNELAVIHSREQKNVS